MTEITHRGGVSGSGSLREFFARILGNRELLRELVRRDLEESYAGSMLSRFWAFAHPLLTILLYLFVFGYVFTARVGANLPDAPDYAVFMLAGLTYWMSAQAALSKTTSALTSASNLVKQVVFPIELLPVRSVLAAQLPLLIGLAGVVLYALLRFGMVSPLLPLVVYVFAAQLAMLVGAGLFLSALTVFVRDTRDIVQFFLTFGVFLVPVIYLPGALPEWFASVLYANPFSYPVWCFQDIFFFQSFAHPVAWPVVGVLGALALWGGVTFFARTRGNFGDVL